MLDAILALLFAVALLGVTTLVYWKNRRRIDREFKKLSGHDKRG
jgi:hypothetical protein